MEEVESVHQLNLEWGCITNLATKIVDIESSFDKGWPELADMLANAFTEESGEKDPASAFFNLYVFLFRLYFRLKANPVKSVFNQYSKQGDEFWIKDYDYKTFKWAVSHGFGSLIDNKIIKIPVSNLSDNQIAALERRCK